MALFTNPQSTTPSSTVTARQVAGALTPTPCQRAGKNKVQWLPTGMSTLSVAQIVRLTNPPSTTPSSTPLARQVAGALTPTPCQRSAAYLAVLLSTVMFTLLVAIMARLTNPLSTTPQPPASKS